MRFSNTVAVAAALAPFAEAHGGVGVPQVHGLLNSLDPRADALVANFKTGIFGLHDHAESSLEVRASGQECGEGIGSCPADRGCCSTAGCM